MLLSVTLSLILVELILAILIIFIKTPKFNLIASRFVYVLGGLAVIFSISVAILPTNIPSVTPIATADGPYVAESEIQEPESSAEKTTSNSAYSATLTAGHYTVGIDIPSGTYSFFVKSGFGNLLSSDGKVNEIFDANTVIGNDFPDLVNDTLKNVSLADGDMLSVLGTLEVSAGCNDSGETADRNQDLTEIELGYGTFAAGDDFSPGTYTLIWLEGFGNVISDSQNSDHGINEIFGTKQGEKGSLTNELYENIYTESYEIPQEVLDTCEDINAILGITEFKNVTFKENDLLKIEDVKIKLVPSP